MAIRWKGEREHRIWPTAQLVAQGGETFNLGLILTQKQRMPEPRLLPRSCYPAAATPQHSEVRSAHNRQPKLAGRLRKMLYSLDPRYGEPPDNLDCRTSDTYSSLSSSSRLLSHKTFISLYSLHLDRTTKMKVEESPCTLSEHEMAVDEAPPEMEDHDHVPKESFSPYMLIFTAYLALSCVVYNFDLGMKRRNFLVEPLLISHP